MVLSIALKALIFIVNGDNKIKAEFYEGPTVTLGLKFEELIPALTEKLKREEEALTI